MKKTILFVLLLFLENAVIFAQTNIVQVPIDSVMNYYSDAKIIDSLETLFSINHKKATEVILINNFSCIHDNRRTIKIIRFDSMLTEVVYYDRKGYFNEIHDKNLSGHLYDVVLSVGNSNFVQQNQRLTKCGFDMMLIKHEGSIRAFTVGIGGFVFSGYSALPDVWKRVLTEIMLLPNIAIKNQTKSKKKKRGE